MEYPLARFLHIHGVGEAAMMPHKTMKGAGMKHMYENERVFAPEAADAANRARTEFLAFQEECEPMKVSLGWTAFSPVQRCLQAELRRLSEKLAAAEEALRAALAQNEALALYARAMAAGAANGCPPSRY